MKFEGNGPWKLYRMTDNQVGLRVGTNTYFSLFSPNGSIQIIQPTIEAIQVTQKVEGKGDQNQSGMSCAAISGLGLTSPSSPQSSKACSVCKDDGGICSCCGVGFTKPLPAPTQTDEKFTNLFEQLREYVVAMEAHGCTTGDCPHEKAVECSVDLNAFAEEILSELVSSAPAGTPDVYWSLSDMPIYITRYCFDEKILIQPGQVIDLAYLGLSRQTRPDKNLTWERVLEHTVEGDAREIEKLQGLLRRVLAWRADLANDGFPHELRTEIEAAVSSDDRRKDG